MKKNFLSTILLPLVLIYNQSCYKAKEPSNQVTNGGQKEEEKSDSFCSLKINTNFPDATNYSVNVDNLTKIKKGTFVTIKNEPGYYKIIQFLSSNNELLSLNQEYTFQINNDITEINLIFRYDLNYYFESYRINGNGKANIIVMAGQSNMEGTESNFYTNLSVDERAIYQSGHDNVKINYNSCAYNNYTDRKYSSGTFVDVDFGQGVRVNYFGPEVGLSKYLGVNSPNEKYFLIKVAYSGTSLNYHWNINKLNQEDPKFMYRRLLQCVDSCLNTFNTRSELTPKITGFCWMQGEGDAASDASSNNYETNFVNLQNAFKKYYENYISEDFVWVSAGISTDCPSVIYPDRVNNVLKTYSDKYISESETLPKVGKNYLHYSAKSYLKLGEYFGRELLS